KEQTSQLYFRGLERDCYWNRMSSKPSAKNLFQIILKFGLMLILVLEYKQESPEEMIETY
ncbi:hypothetical protein pb186bvf_009178, partial [Paramecium bursaria]